MCLSVHSRSVVSNISHLGNKIITLSSFKVVLGSSKLESNLVRILKMVGTKEVFALKLATTKYQSSSSYGCNFLVSTIYIINLQTVHFNKEYPKKRFKLISFIFNLAFLLLLLRNWSFLIQMIPKTATGVRFLRLVLGSIRTLDRVISVLHSEAMKQKYYVNFSKDNFDSN